MDFAKIDTVYFLGIGGIGMSALARYFKANGKSVAGYDLTSTPLTVELSKQGMHIHYTDSVDFIPSEYTNPKSTLVVLTPAIPKESVELAYFIEHGFTVLKRAQVLGVIFNAMRGVAVAGTHGKTSVTTFTAFLLKECGIDCSAFLGGISKNFNSNLVLGASEYVIAEADEFDRSFLHLHPHLLLVTTVDSDHLDIYKDFEDITNTFNRLIEQVHTDGTVILNHAVQLEVPKGKRSYTYSYDNQAADFYAKDIRIEEGAYCFTLCTPQFTIDNLRLQVPGKINVENAIAAMAISVSLGVDAAEILKALPQLRGAVRRFDIQYKKDNKIYIDDYAHHPRELDAVIGSIREMFPGKKLTAVFQPHLFSRTNDFADEFAESLSKVDELILLDIYPAREKPMAGVTSDMLFDKILLSKKVRCSKVNLLNTIKGLNIEILLTIGAGDIDQFVKPIKEMFELNG
jgi:UDP-N-acetylmuramate--alanine ligase